MCYYAKMNGNLMQISVKQDDRFLYQKELPIGEQLLDFVYYDLKKLNEALDNIFSLVVFTRDHNADNIFKHLDSQNIYLRFFAKLFVDELFAGEWKTKIGFDKLYQHYQREIDILKEYAPNKKITYRSAGKAFLIGVFTLRASSVQQFIESQLKFCLNYSCDKIFAALTPTQRLYLYEHWRRSRNEQPLYFGAEFFPSRLVVDRPLELPQSGSLEELALLMQKENPVIEEMTVLENGYALVRFELMKMVTQNIPIKTCANCGRYFIPVGRSDIEYCNRPIKGQPDKTCQSVGAMIKYQHKTRNDPIYWAYTKAYKRNNSRVRYGKLSQADFLAWSDEARAMRDQCLNGEIQTEQYLEWLNRDRLYKKPV